MQKGMLFHTLYAPESGVYFQQTVYTLHGDLDVSAFIRAWQRVVERHPILRTLFLWEQRDKPLQVVRRRVKLPWMQHDWRGLSRPSSTAAGGFPGGGSRPGLRIIPGAADAPIPYPGSRGRLSFYLEQAPLAAGYVVQLPGP